MRPDLERVIRYLAEAGMATTNVVIEQGLSKLALEELEGQGYVERAPRRGNAWRGYDVWRLSDRGRRLAAA